MCVLLNTTEGKFVQNHYIHYLKIAIIRLSSVTKDHLFLYYVVITLLRLPKLNLQCNRNKKLYAKNIIISLLFFFVSIYLQLFTGNIIDGCKQYSIEEY